MHLREQFGDIDIYLFDQLLRGRISPGMRVFDAGCGGGRNLRYLMKAGFEVFGNDANPAAIEAVRELAASYAPQLSADNFRAEPIEETSFAPASADFVISSAVLHFARDDEHFGRMLWGSWDVLRPGGVFFCRLASTIGMERQLHAIAGRRYRLPDSSDRYLVDAPLLQRLGRDIGGELLDPIKTTVVDEQRSMTTWVMRKR